MDCTIITCTRNRSAQLVVLLDSFAAMAVPAGLEWEILLVDNGSDDDTAAVIAAFADRLPIRRIWEPRAGVSYARNTGVGEARGRLICWTDDDTRVVPGWLAAFHAAFVAHPEAVLFAGRVTPLLLPPTPDWFRAAAGDLHYLLAARDFGPTPVPLAIAGERMPFGASAAVRAAEQKAFLYDPDLGVAPGRRRGGEETAVYVALLRAGYTGWWVPDAEVEHRIVSDRQTTEYIRLFYASMGEAWAREAGHDGVPLLTRAKVAAGTLRFAATRAVGHAGVRSLASLSFHRGALAWFRDHRS